MACLRASNDQLAAKKTRDKPIIQIYTDWANHYLERGKYRRFIQDLQADVTDGVLLADVIEAVTGLAVTSIARRPKGVSQMIENIQSCLNLLSSIGVSLDGISPHDVRDGNLKVILSLFFNLSRYKQSQKVQPIINGNHVPSAIPNGYANEGSKLVPPQKIPTSGIAALKTTNKDTSSSSIPGLANRRNTIDRSSKNHSNGIPGSKPSPSRPTSPHGNNSSIPRTKPPEKSQSRPSSTVSSSSIPHLPTPKANGAPPRPISGAMLDKFKMSSSKSSGLSRVESSSSIQSDSRTGDSSESNNSRITTKNIGRKSTTKLLSKDSMVKMDNGKPAPIKPKPALKPDRFSSSGMEFRTLPAKPDSKNEIKLGTNRLQNGDSSRNKIRTEVRQSKISNIRTTSCASIETNASEEDNNSSGIPKPTATVRGTTKPDKRAPPPEYAQPEIKLNKQSSILDPPGRIPQPSQSKLSRNDIYVPIQIPCDDISKGKGRGIAMVSPMIACTNKTLNTISEGAIIKNTSPYKNIAAGGGESPQSKVFNLDFWRRKPIDEEEGEEEMLVKPMQPLTTSPYGYARRLVGPLSNCKTLPPGNMTTLDGGYLSDGDVLAWRVDDVTSGYLSEGGASLYSRTRAPTKTINVLQDDSGNRAPQVRKGLDDSSSLSSGISDTLADFSTDDNLTGSSSDYARSHRTPVKQRHAPSAGSTPANDWRRYVPPEGRRGSPVSGNRKAPAACGEAKVRHKWAETPTSTKRNNASGVVKNGKVSGKVKVSANTQTCTQDLNSDNVYLRGSDNYAEPWLPSVLDSAESYESLPSQLQHARTSSLSEDRPSSTLSRSDSIRSTKSEQVYPSMLQRSTDSPATKSDQTYSLRSSRGSCQYMPSGYSLRMHQKEEDDFLVHGSSLSLMSSSSSIYTSEEKQHHEIRRLRKELDQANDKIATLTSQLTTNAHVVAAFEQSLSNMTTRLQHLTVTAEQKDSELHELRSTIEALKQQSAEAGLTKMALQSMQAVHRTLQQQRMSRQLSADSVSSVNSLSSGKSGESGDSNNKKKKKKGWLRSSFSKAFTKSKKNKHGSVSDVEEFSVPNSPMLNNHHIHHPSTNQIVSSNPDESEQIRDLKKQLREKDMILTDIRLDSLSSAHQLDTLKEKLSRLRLEMGTLKQDNEQLHRIMAANQALENNNIVDMFVNEGITEETGQRIPVGVRMSQGVIHIGALNISLNTQWEHVNLMVELLFKDYLARVDTISNLGLNKDSIVDCKMKEINFKSNETQFPEQLPFDYIGENSNQINLVLKAIPENSADSLVFETLIPKSIIQRYLSLLIEHRRIILCGPSGTGKTYLAQKLAEYLVSKQGKSPDSSTITTFHVDHKSAKELRQYLSFIAEKCDPNLQTIPADLPIVIILDSLHHVGSLSDVFNGFLNAKYQSCPYIIGTMNQATCSTTNCVLQLHHNFRWVLCANHMEPVQGFLGRYLRRKLIEEEVNSGLRCTDLSKVVDWIPNVWHHLNRFLETHSSSDVTIGPRLFLSCPVDMAGSQVWFTDLWNYSIVPYLMEAVREGLQMYGRRAAWEDPTEWVIQTYPWPTAGQPDWPQLLRLRPEDVGYEGHPGPGNTTTGNSEAEADPLLNMLMRLQEAASYSAPRNSEIPISNVPIDDKGETDKL